MEITSSLLDLPICSYGNYNNAGFAPLFLQFVALFGQSSTIQYALHWLAYVHRHFLDWLLKWMLIVHVETCLSHKLSVTIFSATISIYTCTSSKRKATVSCSHLFLLLFLTITKGESLPTRISLIAFGSQDYTLHFQHLRVQQRSKRTHEQIKR